MTAARSILLTAGMCLAFAACGGPEGPRWHGAVEHEGVTVHYETYYAPPSIVERVNNASGIAARLAINGKTMMLSPGIKYPEDWRNQGNLMDYSREFWAAVTDKFSRVDPSEDHADEHYLVASLFRDLRDSPRTLPADPREQALKVTVPVHTDPHEKQTTDEEDACSNEMGEKAIAHYRAEHPDEFRRCWSSGSCDVRRMKNRGFRQQNREPGYEYQQRIEIWADHAVSFLGWDHSGTKAYTFRRPVGSHGEWQQVGMPYNACNHGWPRARTSDGAPVAKPLAGA